MIKAPHDHNDTTETFQRTRSTDYDVVEEEMKEVTMFMDFLVVLAFVLCAMIVSHAWYSNKSGKAKEQIEQTTDEKTISKAKETR